MHTITDPAELTAEQTALIAAAAKNGGRLRVAVSSDTHGRAVRTKTERFFDPEDSSVAAHYVEQVGALKHLMLLREVDRCGDYELTNFGWLLSRKVSLAEKSQGT